jgi:hypothetical protein
VVSIKRIIPLKIFILCLILFSCKNVSKSRDSSIDYIDISFNNKDGMTSVYIDSSKVIRVNYINKSWEKFYFKDTLVDSIFNQIDKLIVKALYAKHDSIVNHQTCFTSAYNLNLSYKKDFFSVIVYQDPTTTYLPLDSLTKMIYRISKTITRHSSDSTFKFNTLSRISDPPPPSIELVKFVPPKLK